VTSPDRRAATVAQAAAGLRAEWKYWQAQADRATLQKHASQIDGVVGTLEAGLQGLAQVPPSDRYDRILDLHHVWDFFRSKLVLRTVEPLRPFLEAADEYAWALYRPAVEASGHTGTLREPPLVYLDRGMAPFAAARGSSYRDLLPRDVRTGSGAAAASVLPFPVIGVPWYFTAYLPGALLIAHEVGHHIEDDCRLKDELTACLGDAGLAAWTPWASEVFADVVAAVACGSPYLTVLEDAMDTAPDEDSRYPPAKVRVALCRAVATGEPSSDEAGIAAAAIAGRRWAGLGGGRLEDIVRPGTADKVPGGAAGLLGGLASRLSDVRAVLPAAALAFHRDPAQFLSRKVSQRAVAEVLALRPKGRRASNATAAARNARDASAATALLDLLADPRKDA
jgi:hypothetical protein